MTEVGTRALNARIWEREEHEHYVEPRWVSRRLLDVEKFDGSIRDPACGFGHICDAIADAGYGWSCSDIVNRGYQHQANRGCFLGDNGPHDNIITNPPFDIFEKFAIHALKTTREKVAMVWLVRRLNAARWLQDTPLARVYLLTPRPSMPPGHVIASGEKPGGGTQDFAWLVWDKAHVGGPELKWLHRDSSKQSAVASGGAE